MELAIAVESANADGQDRAAVLPFCNGHLLVLADGAGGVSGGAEAAQAVIGFARKLDHAIEPNWTRTLSSLDGMLAADRSAGETTAVFLLIGNGRVTGASVGDSEAWSISGGAVLELTGRQRRKPLLGSGIAVPVGFGPAPAGDRVVLASDGLFRYVRPDLVARLATLAPHDAVQALVGAARLPNGALQDDVAIIVAG